MFRAPSQLCLARPWLCRPSFFISTRLGFWSPLAGSVDVFASLVSSPNEGFTFNRWYLVVTSSESLLHRTSTTWAQSKLNRIYVLELHRDAHNSYQIRNPTIREDYIWAKLPIRPEFIKVCFAKSVYEYFYSRLNGTLVQRTQYSVPGQGSNPDRSIQRRTQ